MIRNYELMPFASIERERVCVFVATGKLNIARDNCYLFSDLFSNIREVKILTRGHKNVQDSIRVQESIFYLACLRAYNQPINLIRDAGTYAHDRYNRSVILFLNSDIVG